jgi:hypothetical protein
MTNDIETTVAVEYCVEVKMYVIILYYRCQSQCEIDKQFTAADCVDFDFAMVGTFARHARTQLAMTNSSISVQTGILCQTQSRELSAVIVDFDEPTEGRPKANFHTASAGHSKEETTTSAKSASQKRARRGTKQIKRTI